MAPLLDRAIDAFAMWTEDRRVRAAMGFREASGAPLGCFGALPPLPGSAPRSGLWHAPSPRPVASDPTMAVHASPCRGVRRGTAVLVPPWKVPRLGVISGYASLLSRAGYDVWTLVPPRHLHRALPGMRSGEGFVSPDLVALRATFEQLVLEIRALTALARAGGGRVGVVGLSLGALGAALAATAPEPLDFAALVAPPADLAAVFAETPIGRRYLALARRAGAPPPPADALARMLAPFRADARTPTAQRVFVAVARDDRIALGPGALALARAWGATARLYPRGHLTLLFACRALRRDLARFVAAPG